MTIYIGGQRTYVFISTSNLARIATKLCENAFQTIPDVSLFDAKIFFGENFRIENFVFRQKDMLFEDLGPNGPQNQLPRQILL